MKYRKLHEYIKVSETLQKWKQFVIVGEQKKKKCIQHIIIVDVVKLAIAYNKKNY